MILGIRSDDGVILAASFNHYRATGLSDADLASFENSPFVIHPQFPKGIIAVSDRFQLKYAIETLKLKQTLDLTQRDSVTEFVETLSESLYHDKVSSKLMDFEDSILLAQGEHLISVDRSGIIEVPPVAAYGYRIKSCVISALELTTATDSLEKIRYVFETVEKFTNQKHFPVLIVDTKDPKLSYLNTD